MVTASPRPELTIEGSTSWADARYGEGGRGSTDASIRRDWWGRGSIKLGGEWTKETVIESHRYRRWYGPTLDVTYYVSPTTSLMLHGNAFDWKNQSKNEREPLDYAETRWDLTFSLGNSRALTLSMTRATERLPEYDYDDEWYSAQLAWAFGNNHDLTLKVGEERGGVVCSGGVCRTEQPFTGVRLELLSRF
jgi:hypothetical protein